MSRQGENLKSMEKLEDGVPVSELLRLRTYALWELAKVTGVRKFYLAYKSAKKRHGG